MSDLKSLFDTRHPRGNLVSDTLSDITAKYAKDGHKAGTALVATLKNDEEPQDIEIKKLWDNPRNQDVVKAFMTNRLCIEAAAGKKEALEAYKKYAVQDYFYLVDWVQFRALRAVTVPRGDFNLDDFNTELESVANATGYPGDWLKTCLEEIGLSKKDFEVERTIAELAYSQYLQNNAHSSTWYNLHVILIGCYWAWSKLAVELYKDKNTQTDTIFYKTWILPNVDCTDPKNPTLTSSAKKLSKFLDEHVKYMTSTLSNEDAQALFRATFRLEVGLFDSGFDKVTPKPPPGP
ncbi:hypothetical protein GYMLUDRAFT_265653 [Collybiopsis luxurians FD-317 M1]|uniref:Thiaminase-2/PQQC domain-containing protein n=1 Tax=Collybiopsis luxurians FD-317 M1 TaxID=944289 RepID=A0A0D0BC32_9AGAR|nr:hypothetical protein GYMLUDRAFT_265653 [Collybiopsis luxurians FD-317 M1]